MQRLLLVVAVSLFVTFGVIPPQVAHVSAHLTATVAAQEDPATITVYTTRTGEKYHRDGSRYLCQSRIAPTRKNAVARGDDACSACNPPTTKVAVPRVAIAELPYSARRMCGTFRTATVSLPVAEPSPLC